jgi:hypothetical protein
MVRVEGEREEIMVTVLVSDATRDRGKISVLVLAARL